MSSLSRISPLNQDSILDKKVKNAGREKFKKNKIHILFCGFSCCNNELGELFSTEYDIEKYGFYITEKPEIADVLIFSGAYTDESKKDFLEDVYNKMSEPKHTISVGSCANGDGIYFKETDRMFKDESGKLVKADIFIPGCPPTAEAILYGMLKLKEQY